jgi:hypothetical protein
MANFFRRAGKQIKRSARRIGSQVKRSAAVSAPILTGGLLGTRIGVSIAKTTGKHQAGVLKRMSPVSKAMGRVEQVGATIAATWFGGPVAGAAAYRGTTLSRTYTDRMIRQARGMDSRPIQWKEQGIRTAATVAAAYVGATALGTGAFTGVGTSLGYGTASTTALTAAKPGAIAAAETAGSNVLTGGSLLKTGMDMMQKMAPALGGGSTAAEGALGEVGYAGGGGSSGYSDGAAGSDWMLWLAAALMAVGAGWYYFKG